MDRVADNLRSRLHSVYAQQPEKTLALRLRHPVSLSWRLAGYALTVTTPFGATTHDLKAHTIGSLANALVASGHDIAYRNSDIDHLSARILMEGAGDQDNSNGDHVYAYTSLLWVLLGGAGLAYDDARAAVPAALRQLILPQSRHEWADLFGAIFGIPRDPGETDPVYTQRIIWEVQRRRSNPFAISANIRYRTGDDIRVREPWQEIFVLSESPMDDDFHLQGAPIWQYHTAQLVATTGVRWPKVLQEAYADRPAGTIYLDPATHYPGQAVDCGGHRLTAWQEITLAQQVWLQHAGILSVNLDLSNYATILNHPAVIYELVMLYCASPADVPIWSNPDPANALWLGSWDTRVWSSTTQRMFYPPVSEYAGIVLLSGEHPLGDLQCHFAGSRVVEIGEPLALSDAQGLSDYAYRLGAEPIDVWEEQRVSERVDASTATTGMVIDAAVSDTAYPPPYFRASSLYPDTVQGQYAVTCSEDGAHVYLVDGGNSIRVSEDGGATFATVTPSGYVGGGHALTCSGTAAVALVRDAGQYFLTLDGGTSWAPVPSLAGHLPEMGGFCVSQDGDFLAVAARSIAADGNGVPLARGLMVSLDGGGTWAFRAVGGAVLEVACSADGQALIAICDGAVLLSEDAGATWADISAVVSPPGGYVEGVAISADGGTLMVGGEYGPRVSADGGVTWARAGNLTHASACAMSATGDRWVVALADGAHLSTDAGQTWVLADSARPVGHDQVETVSAPAVAAFIGDLAGWRFWPSPATRLPYLAWPA